MRARAARARETEALSAPSAGYDKSAPLRRKTAAGYDKSVPRRRKTAAGYDKSPPPGNSKVQQGTRKGVPETAAGYEKRVSRRRKTAAGYENSFKKQKRIQKYPQGGAALCSDSRMWRRWRQGRKEAGEEWRGQKIKLKACGAGRGGRM